MSNTGGTLSEADGRGQQKSAGGSTLGRWYIWALIVFAVVCVAVGVWRILSDSSPRISGTGHRPAPQYKQSEGDMTPPPADVSAPRECPQVDMTPPPRRLEVEATRQPPPRADDGGIITLPQARGTTTIPGPVGDAWTKWVRTPTRAGFSMKAHSLPEEAKWVRDHRDDEDSEGYKWTRWRHKEGAVRATTVVLVVE